MAHSQSGKNPWVILGIPRNSTVEEIKAQYKKLALTLHPDKYEAGISDEERKTREDRFKDVSVAYQVALNIATKSKDQDCNWDEYEDSEKWRNMWERVEGMIRNKNIMSVFSDVVKGTFKDMTNIAISRMMSATNPNAPASDISSDVETETETDSDTETDMTSDNMNNEDIPIPEFVAIPRIFKFALSMEEVHRKKSRKVRLFLSEFPEAPFFVDVDFDTFPEMVSSHTYQNKKYKIILEMILKPHPVYHWDNLLHGWDLYTTVPITLTEYFTGCVKHLPKLGEDDTFEVTIPPFSDVKKSIAIPTMGLRNRGTLYIILEILLPTKKSLKKLEKEDPTILSDFLNMCKKLENSNASHCDRAENDK